MGKKIKNLKEAYFKNKKSAIGKTCLCPSCGEPFLKNNYQQAFCKSKSGTKCKDYYWNNVTPSKRNNKTRISPASARYMSRNNINSRVAFFDDHPFSSDALGQY